MTNMGIKQLYKLLLENQKENKVENENNYEDNYDLRKKSQYLVENIETKKQEVMEWQTISFRDCENKMYFIGEVKVIRPAMDHEKIVVETKLSLHKRN